MRTRLIRGTAFLCVSLAAVILFAQDPSKDPDSFDIEPPLLIPNRGDTPLPDAKETASASHDVDLAKLEKEFERAKRSATSAERFCKIGALSKLEAEQRILRAVHLEFDLANARLVSAKGDMLETEKGRSNGQMAKPDLAQAEMALAMAIKAAHAATVKREQADIAAAEANVYRQEKLLALGSARKADVQRAIQKLDELKSARNDQ